MNGSNTLLIVSNLPGHNHIVTSVNWSQCGSRLLTSSDDKSAALWVRGQSDPVLVFNRMVKSTPEGQVSKKVQIKIPKIKILENTQS